MTAAPSPRSKSATSSVVVGLLAALLAVLGVVGAHFAFLGPSTGLALFSLALVFGVLGASGLGAVGLYRTRQKAGRPLAVLGLVLGEGLLFVLVVLVVLHWGKPRIHDVTTDPDDPPAFGEIAGLPENEGRDLTYPHGGIGVPELQRAAYPDLVTLELPLPPGDAWEAAVAVTEELGWSLVWSNRELGTIEATERSKVFRFVDDVVVRVRAAPAGSVVDVRSTSRVGRSDLGANARRIREFLERLRAAAAL